MTFFALEVFVIPKPESSFGSRLRLARERKNLTQKDLSDLIQKDEAVISKWERDRNVPQKSNINLLAHALGVNLTWLRNGAGPMEVPPAFGLSHGHVTTVRARKSTTGDITTITTGEGEIALAGNPPFPLHPTDEIQPEAEDGTTVRIPYLSSAWGFLDQLMTERGLTLTDDEHSRILVQSSMAGIREDREPVLKDVLAALADVLGRE